MAQAIPEGYATITPTLIFDDAAAAMTLYTQAFGATEDYRTLMPNGKIMHACLQIGSSKLFLSDLMPNCGSSTQHSCFYLYVEDVDAACAKAAEAGLELTMPPADMFWGDRMGALKDKFGIRWTIATHQRDLSPDEMEQAKNDFLASMAGA